MRPAFSVFAAVLLAATGAAQARDLSLAEAETQVVARNRELQAARRAVESAGAVVEIAGVRPNAVLSLNATSISASPGLGPGSLGQKRMDTVLRIDQPLERGDKRELRVDAAEGLARAATADARDVLRQQLAAVRGAYYELKLAEEKGAVLAEMAALLAQSLEAARRRLQAGDLAAADVARIEVDHDRARNDLRAAETERTRAQLALGFLVGEEAGAAFLRAADPWPALQRADGVVQRADALAVAQAVDARPDVVAAGARVAAAERLRELARAQRTRDVTVGAQVERYPGTVPQNSIGFGIAIPLFTGNDYSGDIRKAEVDRHAALDALARVRALAENDLRRAAAELNGAAERLARFDATLAAAARRSAEAAEFAFRRGATSALELLDARRTYRSVMLDGLAARADHARALAAWRASHEPVAELAPPSREPNPEPR